MVLGLEDGMIGPLAVRIREKLGDRYILFIHTGLRKFSRSGTVAKIIS